MPHLRQWSPNEATSSHRLDRHGAAAAHPAPAAPIRGWARGGCLKTQFFEPDAYGSYREPRYWVRFVFWWPNL